MTAVPTFLGLLLLDTRFPRAAGDAGRPDSYAMPVRAARVLGATPQRVVRDDDTELLQPFIDAALSLQADGAAAITTSWADLVEAATRLLRRHPRIRHVVLECTNMPPYADAVARATGRPVHHLLTLVRERWKKL